MKFLKNKLKDILLRSQKISEENLNNALKIQKRTNQSLKQILIENNFVSEKDLLMLLSEELRMPPIALSRYKVDPDVIDLVPEKTAKRYHLIPLSRIGRMLTIAIADPLNIFAIDEIKMITKYEIDCVLSEQKDIEEAISQYYGRETADINEILDSSDIEVVEEEEEDSEEEEVDIEKIAQESSEAPVIKLVNFILIDAIRKKASDIHIEPFRKEVRVRYRIDGALNTQTKIPKKYQNAVIARLKIRAKLDITEFRVPQDGRFKVMLDGRDIDFRVSLLPVAFGGKIVLRALDRSSLSLGLDKLGYLPETLARFSDGLKRPYGMVLVTGPTGSGKSTTLYSVLNELNKPERNIITVEDPVEYQLDGATQMQVIPEVGFSFAEGLRSILRQSPDTIMVGEIRDSETADIAIKAALTGHMVFSTLHTNDAASAITRLRDMGVEPFLIASSVVMVVAQRLCRKNCQFCKEEYEVSESALVRTGLDPAKEQQKGKKMVFYKGIGCEKCRHTGYLGRIAIAEALSVDDEIRRMIIAGKSADDLKQYAISKGMYTLRTEALERFKMGETTLEEILRVTAEE